MTVSQYERLRRKRGADVNNITDRGRSAVFSVALGVASSGLVVEALPVSRHAAPDLGHFGGVVVDRDRLCSRLFSQAYIIQNIATPLLFTLIPPVCRFFAQLGLKPVFNRSRAAQPGAGAGRFATNGCCMAIWPAPKASVIFGAVLFYRAGDRRAVLRVIGWRNVFNAAVDGAVFSDHRSNHCLHAVRTFASETKILRLFIQSGVRDRSPSSYRGASPVYIRPVTGWMLVRMV